MRSKLIILLSTYFIHAAQWDWYYSDPTPALCGDNSSTMKNSASICTSMMPTVTELIVSQFKEQLRNGRMTPLHCDLMSAKCTKIVLDYYTEIDTLISGF